jgi:hypothetical protein
MITTWLKNPEEKILGSVESLWRTVSDIEKAR